MSETEPGTLFRGYHGTSRDNAKSILREGFRFGTWFAFDRADALHYGGDYVFVVDFPAGGFKGEMSWQFHLRDALPISELRAGNKERLVRLERHYG